MTRWLFEENDLTGVLFGQAAAVCVSEEAEVRVLSLVNGTDMGHKDAQ